MADVMIRRMSFVLPVLLALAACARDAPLPQPAAEPAAATVDTAHTLAHSAVALAPLMRDRVTLARWRAANAGDAITWYTPLTAEPTPGGWCARSEARVVLADERPALRIAYFYPGAAPEPLQLPEPLPEGELANRCELGVVWLETAERDSTSAHVLAVETAATLTGAFGAVLPGERPGWSGSASWREARLWRPAGLQVATAIVAGRSSSDTSDSLPAPRVIVVMAGLRDGVRIDWTRTDITRPAIFETPSPGEVRDRVAALIRAADVDEPTAGRITRLFEAQQPGRSAEVALVLDLVASAATMPRSRAAATLLLADLLTDANDGWSDPREEEPRAILAGRGADFDYGELGGTYVYTRTWAKQALELDPHGPAGELALLTLMERGFETSAGCRDHGAEGFREVIRAGEDFVRSRPSSPIRAHVHFLVADAYADIVALAAGAGYDAEAEAEAYGAEAASARLLALEHYRDGYRLAARSEQAQRSWPTAWRLAAGLAPATTRFYCIYD